MSESLKQMTDKLLTLAGQMTAAEMAAVKGCIYGMIVAVDGSDSDAGNVVSFVAECLIDTMPNLAVREHYHDFKRAGDVLVNMDRLREQSCNL